MAIMPESSSVSLRTKYRTRTTEYLMFSRLPKSAYLTIPSSDDLHPQPHHIPSPLFASDDTGWSEASFSPTIHPTIRQPITLISQLLISMSLAGHKHLTSTPLHSHRLSDFTNRSCIHCRAPYWPTLFVALGHTSLPEGGEP